jgi:ferritin-like metal-binding protein YciE
MEAVIQSLQTHINEQETALAAMGQPLVFERTVPEDASMKQVLVSMKQEIETFEKASYKNCEVLSYMMTQFGSDFTDAQVDQILTFFSEEQRKRIITELNRGSAWF